MIRIGSGAGRHSAWRNLIVVAWPDQNNFRSGQQKNICVFVIVVCRLSLLGQTEEKIKLIDPNELFESNGLNLLMELKEASCFIEFVTQFETGDQDEARRRFLGLALHQNQGNDDDDDHDDHHYSRRLLD